MLPPPGSHFEYSSVFGEMLTARTWGLTPSQWYAEPRWSRATMVETDRKENAMKYWMAEDGR